MVYMKQSTLLATAVALASVTPVLADSYYGTYRRSDLYARGDAPPQAQDGWQVAYNDKTTIDSQDKEIAQLKAQAAAAKKEYETHLAAMQKNVNDETAKAKVAGAKLKVEESEKKLAAAKTAKKANPKNAKNPVGKDGKPVNKAAPKPNKPTEQQLFQQFENFENKDTNVNQINYGAGNPNNVNKVTLTPGGQSAGIKNGVAIDTRPKSRREAYEYAYLQARELLAREAYANAYPEAYAYAEPEADYDEIFARDADLYTRDAEPEEYDSGLFARDAYASYDDLYAREAYADPEAWAEPEADFEELYAREADAYAYAEADADADIDWEAGLYARDAEADAEASLTEYLKRYIGM